jgi:DNA-binding IclR family transcriptional regulator
VSCDTPPPSSRAEPTDLIRSVSRALRVLEEVGRADRPLPVKAIARRSRLKLSTAYHLVRTLCFEGYLTRLPGGDYVVGPAVASRFHDLVSSFGRPPQVRVVLQHLAERTGHSVYLARLRDGQLVVADVIEGPRSPYLEDLQVGLEAAPHATALGKALLRELPAGQRRRWLAEIGMRPFTARTPTDPETVEAELSPVPPHGILVEHGQFREGVSCAGATLHPAGDPVVWAVGVSSRVDELPRKLLDQLDLAVRDLTGCTPFE